MFNENEIAKAVVPADQGRLLFERRAGIRDWDTGKIMPQFVGKVPMIVGFDEVVKEKEPVADAPVKDVDSDAPVGAADEPVKRGRKAK